MAIEHHAPEPLTLLEGYARVAARMETLKAEMATAFFTIRPLRSWLTGYVRQCRERAAHEEEYANRLRSEVLTARAGSEE